MEFVDDQDLPQVSHTDDQEAHDKYAIPVLGRSKYIREINNHDAVHLWDERFAERGDLVENYEPSLSERIKLGEDLAELNSEGFTYTQLLGAGASSDNLKAYGVENKTGNRRKK